MGGHARLSPPPPSPDLQLANMFAIRSLQEFPPLDAGSCSPPSSVPLTSSGTQLSKHQDLQPGSLRPSASEAADVQRRRRFPHQVPSQRRHNPLNLSQLITEPTRPNPQNHNRSTLMDLILSNRSYTIVATGVFDLGISDHCPVVCIRDTHKKKTQAKIVVKRNLRKFNKH